MLLELIAAQAIGFDKHLDAKDVSCMSEAIYFEARDQPIDGQAAVAVTILNRVNSSRFPNTICGVIHQYKQFSYTLKPLQERNKALRSNNTIDKVSLDLSVKVALQAVSGGFDGMHESTHYYNPSLANPKWAKSFKYSFLIHDHRWVF